MSKPQQRTFIRRRGTTTLPNATVFDERISIPALGLLTLILARPEDAPQGYRALQGRGLGKDGLLRALTELGDAGYRHQLTARSPDGRVLTYTVTSEEPIPTDVAHEWLLERLDDSPDRAAESRARRELRKRIREYARRDKGAGGTVRGLPGSGEPGSGEPGSGQPGSGEPGSGQPPHKPSVSKGLSSLRSQDPEERTTDDTAITAEPRPAPPDFRDRDPRLRRASP